MRPDTAVRGLFLLCALAACCSAQRSSRLQSERIAGAANGAEGSFFTWGDRLRVWRTASLTSRVVAEGPFGEGGCSSDLDGDGKLEISSVRGEGLGQLTWYPPKGTPERVDDQMEVHDCLAATLFGRRGLLAIQRGMQIRFYQRDSPGRWHSRDIYSIYTPSYQTGLALADVDGDGLTDILCGNYWVQSPKRWEESWHIFAINTWSEQPESASFRLLVRPDGSVEYIAQAHSDPARFAAFARPADPKQQWTVRMLAPELKLRNIHGLAMAGNRLILGEHAGSDSRLISVDPADGKASLLATGDDIVAILPAGAQRFLSIQTTGVTEWNLANKRRRR